VNAIGADHEIGFDLAAVGKARHRGAAARLGADATMSEAKLRGLERAGEHVEQVGAMHAEIWRAEFVPEIAAMHARDDVAALPRADDEKIRAVADRFDFGLDTERAARLDGIGREVDAGADLAQHGRLLGNDRLGAAPLERQRRRKSADAAGVRGISRSSCSAHHTDAAVGR
jgi:hypothetical protein